MFKDNYAYAVCDEVARVQALVDPAEPDKVLRFVDSHPLLGDMEVSQIWTTHWHADHAGGNERMAQEFPGIDIFGPSSENIPAMTHGVSGGDSFQIGNLDVKVFDTSCHTSGHISYAVENEALFCGDTLFVGGVGRFFEGSAEDMSTALENLLNNLPKSIKVYCGHEYTIQNLEFAQSIDPQNPSLTSKLNWARTQRQNNLPTIPSTLQEELSYNPFLRTHEPAIIKAANTKATDKISILAAIRKMKDNY